MIVGQQGDDPAALRGAGIENDRAGFGNTQKTAGHDASDVIERRVRKVGVRHRDGGGGAPGGGKVGGNDERRNAARRQLPLRNRDDIKFRRRNAVR